MTSLGCCIILYIAVTICIGLYASRYVRNSTDYCLAGRKMSLLLCSSTLFSTWFGSETIIGASSEYLQHGLQGVIEDPFGTALCFLLIGSFIARPLYKMNIMTIVDLFRIKYGRLVEGVAAIFMILSYLGWIAAQFLAMAIIMQVAFGLAVPTGVLVSMGIVCLYTISGGMWSVSINDFIQTLIIIAGLFLIGGYLLWQVPDVSLISMQLPERAFQFFPETTTDAWLKYLVAWMTIGFGSLPQQDVFQRVMSAKSASIAAKSSYIAAVMYIIAGMLPLLIAIAFQTIYPSLAKIAPDQVLLQAVLQQGNIIIQVLFFGALISAIMSSASGAILAPATIIGENLVKTFFPNLSDKQYLRVLRHAVLVTSVLSGLYAANSNSVYLLVAESSVISLVSLFVPFVLALYSKKAKLSQSAALLSITLGPLVWWISSNYQQPHYAVLYGFIASAIGMASGGLMHKIVTAPKPQTVFYP